MVPLIADPRFTAGVRNVGYDCDGPVTYTQLGTFEPGGESAFSEPQWSYTQNHSFYPLANNPKTVTTGEFAGMAAWANPGKTLRMRRDSQAAWDVTVRSRTIAEYRWWTYHHYPDFIPNPATGKFGCSSSWPGYVKDAMTGLWRFADYHKWVHQYLTYGGTPGSPPPSSAPLSALTQINFHLVAKKTIGTVVRNPAYGYTNKSACRFFAMIHAANVKTGRQVAVQIPIYDSRYRREAGWGPMLDGPTGDQMVMLPQSALTTDTLWLDQPVTFNANLADRVKRAVQVSYPNAQLADFVLKSNFVLGVEDSGIADVEVAFRDLALATA